MSQGDGPKQHLSQRAKLTKQLFHFALIQASNILKESRNQMSAE